MNKRMERVYHGSILGLEFDMYYLVRNEVGIGFGLDIQRSIAGISKKVCFASRTSLLRATWVK